MKTKAITDTVRPKNEDAYDTTKKSAFVIDGASGLSDNRFMPRGQDVAWMSKWWREYLSPAIDNSEMSIQEILEKGIDEFTIAYGKMTDLSKLKKYELLSASIGITRVCNGMFQAFVLGDVEIVAEMKDGNIEIITDDTVEYLDKEVINLMKSNPNRSLFIENEGFTAKEMEMLIENRSKMNTPEGYYILSVDKEAIEHGKYMEIPVSEIRSCMIATDGVVPLGDRYSKKELIRQMRERTLESIVEELREIEETYINSREVRRLKEHDDISLIYIEF